MRLVAPRLIRHVRTLLVQHSTAHQSVFMSSCLTAWVRRWIWVTCVQKSVLGSVGGGEPGYRLPTAYLPCDGALGRRCSGNLSALTILFQSRSPRLALTHDRTALPYSISYCQPRTLGKYTEKLIFISFTQKTYRQVNGTADAFVSVQGDHGALFGP